MCTIYFGAFSLLFILPSHWLIGLTLLYIMSYGYTGIGMGIMHDASHDTFSDKPWLNTAVRRLIAALGLSPKNWWRDHKLHHSETNTNRDGDTKTPLGLMRRSIFEPVRFFHRWQHIYFHVPYSLFTLARLFGEIFRISAYQKSGRYTDINPAKEYWIMFFIKIFYLFFMIALPILKTDYSFWEVIIGFVFLHLLTGHRFALIFNLAHVVKGTIEIEPYYNGERWVIDENQIVYQLKTSAGFKTSWIFNYHTSGLGYQDIHHPCYMIGSIHYPPLRERISKLAEEHGVPHIVFESYEDAKLSHKAKLKELGNPDNIPLGLAIIQMFRSF